MTDKFGTKTSSSNDQKYTPSFIIFERLGIFLDYNKDNVSNILSNHFIDDLLKCLSIFVLVMFGPSEGNDNNKIGILFQRNAFDNSTLSHSDFWMFILQWNWCCLFLYFILPANNFFAIFVDLLAIQWTSLAHVDFKNILSKYTCIRHSHTFQNRTTSLTFFSRQKIPPK